MRRSLCLIPLALWGVGVACAQQAAAQRNDAVARGEYIFRAAGGCGCHTDYENDGAAMAGGRPLKTPFGTFYSTNITPDRKTGIGAWSEEDFSRAMREGVGPDGRHYFPVFPYTSFTRMSDADVRDLKAYLFSLPPVRLPNTPHDVWPPFGWRIGVPFWKRLHFSAARFGRDPSRSAEWNRGAYLATVLAHCGECHTPRTLMGASKPDLRYAGSSDGPDGQLAPNITPDEATGIGEWSMADLMWFLESGLRPDGDDAQELMGEVIEYGFQYLTEADRRALAVYLASLPPIHNELSAPQDE